MAIISVKNINKTYNKGKVVALRDLSFDVEEGEIYGIFGTTIEENYDLVKDIYQQIEKFKTRKAGKLWGGMKQKLALSCALIHAPRVLFLDEPTTGVDPVTRRQFWELIYQAADRGITVFVTTHYMDEAEYCDRVSIMVDGKIEALDTPAELKRKFGVSTMYDVFLHLARKAKRS